MQVSKLKIPISFLVIGRIALNGRWSLPCRRRESCPFLSKGRAILPVAQTQLGQKGRRVSLVCNCLTRLTADCKRKHYSSAIRLEKISESYFEKMHPISSILLSVTSACFDEVEGSTRSSIRVREFYQSKTNISQYGSQLDHFIKTKWHCSRDWIYKM